MTFMLGAFTQGLTEGAKDVYGLQNTAANTDATKAHSEAIRQQTDLTKQAFDAGRTLSAGSQMPQQQQQAVTLTNTTPSNTGVAGGGPGTTTNGPVAPLDFKDIPAPTFMGSVAGSPSGFGPGYNPETGPAAAAAQSQPSSSLPSNAPTAVQAPTLAAGSQRVQPTGLGGSAVPTQPTTSAVPTGALGAQPSTPPTPSTPINYDQPLLKQMGKIDMDTPLLKQWFGGKGDATPSAPAAASPPPSPHRQREMDKQQKSAPQQTSSNNIGRHLAGALNIG